MLESSTCTLIIQFNFNLKYPADSNCDSSTGACYNLVESKNTYTKVCSDDLSSFIFMAIETHSSFLLSFGQLCSSFFPSNVIVNGCSCSLFTRRFSASPPNLHKIPRLFRLPVSAFGFHELLLH